MACMFGWRRSPKISKGDDILVPLDPVKLLAK